MAMGGAVIPAARSDLLALVDRESAQRVMSCYQCGKCTAGCPMAQSVPLGPRQVMRAVQLGAREVALGNDLIWLCLSCHTCSVRCPRQIDVAAVMETLRLLAVAEGVAAPMRDITAFHRAFLSVIRRTGHAYELGLGVLFNLLSGRPLSNVTLLPRLLAKGKLPLLPETRSAREVQAIFERVAALEGQPVAPALPEGTVKAAIAVAVVGVGLVAGQRMLSARREAKE